VSARTAGGDEVLPFLHAERVVRIGVAVVVLFFVGFVGWAAFAPLESAMVMSGVVVADADHTAGGVSIAMRVSPEHADELWPGMTAKVDLSAKKVRRLPMLTGVVTYMSPRALEDPRTGQAFFIARLSLDHAPARMLPGMPVRVEIPTGAHTALQYLIEPISDVMHNGMRER